MGPLLFKVKCKDIPWKKRVQIFNVGLIVEFHSSTNEYVVWVNQKKKTLISSVSRPAPVDVKFEVT